MTHSDRAAVGRIRGAPAIGVKRIRVGSALSRAALGAFLRGAREMGEIGTFACAADAVSYAEISALLPNE